LEQLTKAHDLTQELISIEDSPGQQDRLGVILTTHGEILNRQDQLKTSDQTTPEDGRTALDKQQRAVTIFRQLEQTTSGPLREQTLRKLMETLISMADTLENLELYKESQVAMQEAQVIGKRAQSENNTSSLHLHQQICASTKDTMDARRELDDHTSTLHVRSKIRLHGLLSQTLNGKKGIVPLEVIASFETQSTLSAWPYWKPPSARWEDKLDMTQLFRELLATTDREKELTITANTMLHGLHQHVLHDFCSPTPQLINQTTFMEMACDELEKREKNSRITGYEPHTNHSNYQASVIPLLGGG